MKIGSIIMIGELFMLYQVKSISPESNSMMVEGWGVLPDSGNPIRFPELALGSYVSTEHKITIDWDCVVVSESGDMTDEELMAFRLSR